ncbi:MAG: branched-chain amino acid ABC transporter permease [Pseudobdellovibrionaceae bacterium]
MPKALVQFQQYLLKSPPLSAFCFLMILGLGMHFGLNGYAQLLILLMMINMILAMSLNLVNGYTGQFSLGHAGFMAVGAYTSAYLSSTFQIVSPEFVMFSFLLYALIGGLFAAVAGFMVGQPSLRLKGDYLAIVTLGFGEIIRVTILNMDFLGGARGIAGVPGFRPIDLGFITLSKFFLSFLFASICTLSCFFIIWRLVKSQKGRAYLSVREDEIAAGSMGIDTTSTKVKAFVISSFFAGIAGSMMAHFTNFISPSSFTFLLSVNAIIMVVLGGMGSMTGCLIAAAFITFVPELLRPIQEMTGYDLRMIIYSLSLIIIMIIRPRGLFAEKELPDLWKKVAG